MEFRIKEARKNAKITQDQLAKELGINRATLSKYENGTIEPSISQLEKMGKLLGIPWYELYSNYPKEQSEAIITNIKAVLSESIATTTLPDTHPLRHELEKDLRELPKRFEHIKPSDFIRQYEMLDSSLSDLGSLEDQLWYAFIQLNEQGQQKAVERIQELTEIPKYQKTDTPET